MIVGDIATGNHRLFPDIMWVINKKVKLIWRQIIEIISESAGTLVG